MKLLLDNTSFLPIVGGTETYCYQLMTAINPEEVEVRLITEIPEQGPSELNTYSIIRTSDLEEDGPKSGYNDDSYEADLALGMARIFKDKKEAIIPFKTIRDAGLERYYAEIDSFHPDLVLVNDLMRVIAAPYIQHTLFAYSAKLVINFHGILTSFGAFWKVRPDRKQLAQTLMARTDLPIYFIAPSRYVYDTAIEWGVHEDRLKLIYLGVDTGHFVPPTLQEKRKAREQIKKKLNPTASLTDETLLIGFPSRAVSHKGVDTALEALKLVISNKPNLKWILLIAGGASENPEDIKDTYALIKQFDLQDRILDGTDAFVDFPNDMRTFNQACNLCLFPSRREALGYGALESMSCGVPVIGASSFGLSEALGVNPGDSGECPAGWAVVPEDPWALGSQLEAVLENPEILEKKGQEARTWIEEYFTLNRMIAEHLEYFKDIYADKTKT